MNTNTIPLDENAQLDLLARERSEIKERLKSEDYQDAAEKAFLETVLEENIWSMGVIINTMHIKIPIDPIKLFAALADKSIKEAFIYCIVQKDHVQVSLQRLHAAGITKTNELGHSTLTKAIEGMECESCPCSYKFCERKPKISCRKKLIPILKKAVPYEKFVLIELTIGASKFQTGYKLAYDWVMGDGRILSFDDSCQLRGKHVTKIRRAIQQIINMPINKAVRLYEEFCKINIQDMEEDLGDRKNPDAFPASITDRNIFDPKRTVYVPET